MSMNSRLVVLGFCGVLGIAVAVFVADDLSPAVTPPDTPAVGTKEESTDISNSAPPRVEAAARPASWQDPKGAPTDFAQHTATTLLGAAEISPRLSGLELAQSGSDGTESMLDRLQEISRGLADALQSNKPAPPPPTDGAGRAAGNSGAAGDTAAAGDRSVPPAGPSPRTKVNKRAGEGDDLLEVHIPGDDIREVLKLLAETGGLNILAGKNVTGNVSASLTGVHVEQALTAILKSTGFTWRREGKFIYVGTAADFKEIDASTDQVNTRMYLPNYVRAAEISQLLTPLLSEQIGMISVSIPAQNGIATDKTAAGGDGYGGNEVVLVRDYETKLLVYDEIIAEIDRRPAQVAIEAMILSVTLDDEHQWGVDWELLRNKGNVKLGTGNPLADLGNISFDSGGMTFGFLDSSLGSFVNILESIGDTNVIATPRVVCLNKQRAEILIGDQLGYVSTTQTETSTTQDVQFLEVGTQLRIRPFISSDGMIRLEVHPELSSGTVRVEQNFTLPDKQVTEVTTNILARDGATLVIGGLIRDEVSNTTTQLPFFGDLPGVGWLFRNTKETTQRRELIVLITPHIIYDPVSAYRADDMAREFHHHHRSYTDLMNPFGKRHLGQRFFHKAQEAWHRGNQKRALHWINASIQFDPQNRAALDLRSDITSGQSRGDHTDVSPGRVAPYLHPLDGEVIAPWVYDELYGRDHPYARGRAGRKQDLPSTPRKP